jgi:hypothetical protein
MNKRIKELIEQATFTIDVKCEGLMGRSYVIQEEFFDYKKFAELIVRECAAVSDKWDDQLPIGDMIKEHFGVEE